ncbi:multicopper oxidase family protein [Hydrogenophaga crassostreae]|nr:multicopper oxidase domain-containing protein [Hydrogenophaga crassostreae]
MNQMNHQRRLLLLGSAGAVVTASIGTSALAAQGKAGADVDVHIELHALPDQVSIRSGKPTQVWRYRSKLLRGEPHTLEASAGGYLGPIIRVRRGQRIRIDLINGLPESTIIHWHGLHVPEEMDGHPRFAIAPGARYVYEFKVDNRAGSYWFHPHPHGRTGKQVYAGLAGLFLVSDDEEAALNLPSGAQDLPLVIQDRNFDADNQFVYLGGGKDAPSQRRGMMGGGMMSGGMMGGGGMGSMMAGMMGVLGDQVLVNGSIPRQREVERRAHRLRLLNASNTRTLKLAWSDQTPLTVIGSDGGLLAAPLQRDYVMLAPAERVELWVNFSRWAGAAEPTLRSLAFEGGIAMGSMMGGGGSLSDGAAFDVLRFKVSDGKGRDESPPARLSTIAKAEPLMAVNYAHPKVFELTMGMMVWGINGESFDMLGASELETVKLGTNEIWEFRNEGRGSMMGMVMPHSMHVHGLQFRVLTRSVSRKFSDEYDSVKAGFVDDGWKDTVLVMPGERVRVLLRFADFAGLFLYHCHMLEHEDTGLMRNYRVEA